MSEPSTPTRSDDDLRNSTGEVQNKTGLNVKMIAINRSTDSQPTTPNSRRKDKKGGIRGLFSRKGKSSGKGTGKPAQVDGPTNFSHDVHATWDPVNGFTVNSISRYLEYLYCQSGRIYIVYPHDY